MMSRLAIVVLLLITVACELKRNGSQAEDDKPFVAVVNYPLYHFAKSIGKELITVYFPVIDGDPAYWKPDARQISNFQKADLILDNGAGYAAWMEKVSLPSSRIINTSADFRNEWIAIEESVTHSHGPEGEHVHQGTAGTTWLNFKFAHQQATATLNALIKLMPDHEDTLRENYKELQNHLSELDDRMIRIGTRLQEVNLLASHPVYQYLEEAYGFRAYNLHWEPDEIPDAVQWSILAGELNSDLKNIMLWEEAPLPEVKLRLTELGVEIAVFNPCGNRPESGDFVSTMAQSISQLEQII
jgi:zinc transport system substrate-binding protein